MGMFNADSPLSLSHFLAPSLPLSTSPFSLLAFFFLSMHVQSY